MNRIGEACSNRPVYFYFAVPSSYCESKSQLIFSNPERVYMSTAATSAPRQQGISSLGALVHQYWANSRSCCLRWSKHSELRLGALLSEIDSSVYDTAAGTWACEKGATTLVQWHSALYAHWQWAGAQSLSLMTLLATCNCSRHGQRDILAECQLSIAR